MKVNKLFSTAATICVVCFAALLTQTVFSGFATAKPGNENSGDRSLKQRIMELELNQIENEKDFFLIDTSLSDLDSRVLELEKRADDPKTGKRADHRVIVNKIKEGRKIIRR